MRKMNLLPSSKQQELYYEKLYHSVAVAAVIGVIILLMGILAQMVTRVYLTRTQNSIDSQIEALKLSTDKTEYGELKNEIRTINSQMVDFEALAAQTPQWSGVLIALSKQVPAGVKIMRLEADSKDQKVTINGFSPTRDLVIELYNNINSDKDHFKDVNYPLENVSKPTDIEFYYSFTIADGVLVPKK